ncbi:GNAT family N-acetyltransferase [Gabonibacter chumensis]|uniref:GNAT family N-acetyltransferase n=1 Tax=Gabonibacter chumensis TaxID=2972474 RepID=UPI0025728553|nr:GNAT family N-acetyltransferase [Gabonibacter chumensis]MCR9012828.1 GNAT family N-acetyltransferase [Gabonibacter chumensis]
MEYKIQQLSFDDNWLALQKVVDLQNIVYAGTNHKFSLKGFKHLYVDNPLGHVISFNAFYGDDMVAHYACIPVKMKIQNNLIDGVLSLATVTHPNHRGKGLFTTLAKKTYDYARDKGYKFVIGVANANSIHGFMKYFNFTLVSRLNVMWGWGTDIKYASNKTYSVYWDEELLNWRLSKQEYAVHKTSIVGKTNFYKFRNVLGVKTFMGVFPEKLLTKLNLKKSNNFLRPLNLYVGLGADLKNGHYFSIPGFIKHSPFNLIFMDLTGNLPPVTKDNIFFQLIDFDVA